LNPQIELVNKGQIENKGADLVVENNVVTKVFFSTSETQSLLCRLPELL
jgi:hypothetical protein